MVSCVYRRMCKLGLVCLLSKVKATWKKVHFAAVTFLLSPRDCHASCPVVCVCVLVTLCKLLMPLPVMVLTMRLYTEPVRLLASLVPLHSKGLSVIITNRTWTPMQYPMYESE